MSEETIPEVLGLSDATKLAVFNTARRWFDLLVDLYSLTVVSTAGLNVVAMGSYHDPYLSVGGVNVTLKARVNDSQIRDITIICDRHEASWTLTGDKTLIVRL